MPLTPRPGILDIPPYPIAEPIAAGGPPFIMLASNECAAEPGPMAQEAYRRASAALRPYPDGSAAPLRHAIATTYGLDPARVVCGNGSEELIMLLLLAYAGPGAEVVHTRFGYLLFKTAARIMGAVPVAAEEPGLRVNVDALLAAVTPRTRALFLANPNNPTGFRLPPGEIERLRRGLRDDILLVLDGAYVEYADEPHDAGFRLVDAADNTVVLRTFSKIHGLAGLRVGWCYGPAGVADALHRVRPPSNLSGPAMQVAAAALGDTAHVDALRRQNVVQRERLADALRRRGFSPYPSSANFVLARLSSAAAASAAYAAFKANRILVRPMTAYDLPDCLRITIGKPGDMDAVIAALERIEA